MFNYFMIEGEVLNVEEHVAPSGAIKEIITLCLDTSFTDKKTGEEVVKQCEFRAMRYRKEGQSALCVGDYVLVKGRVFASTNRETGEGFPNFIIEEHIVLNGAEVD